MSKFTGDHRMTATVTAAQKHRGELPDDLPDRREQKRLIAEASNERTLASRWGQVAHTLIEMRNDLRSMGGDRSLHVARHEPEAVDLFARAANALGASIAEAVRHQREHEGKCEAAWEASLKIDAAIRAANPPPGMSNVQMSALLHRERQRQVERINRDGCCGAEPAEDGFCFGYGPCPRHKEINSCVGFCERLLAWAEQLSENPTPVLETVE